MIRALLLSMVLAVSALAADADWKIAMTPLKAAQPDTETPVTFRVADAAGKPVAGADVEAVLTMIEMDHGESKFPAKEIKPGVYRTKVKFLMSGAWNIEARVKKGADRTSRKFKYIVK